MISSTFFIRSKFTTEVILRPIFASISSTTLFLTVANVLFSSTFLISSTLSSSSEYSISALKISTSVFSFSSPGPCLRYSIWYLLPYFHTVRHRRRPFRCLLFSVPRDYVL